MKSSVRNLFLMIAVLFLGVAMPNFAHASAFSGYTCDLKNIEPSQRPASGIFLNLKKVRIFVSVGSLSELQRSDFPLLLKPDALGKMFQKQAEKVFAGCFDDPDSIDIEVVQDKDDPVFEKSGTLGIYATIFVGNIARTDPKSPMMAHAKLTYYRQDEGNRFSYTGQMPWYFFLLDYTDPETEKKIEKLSGMIQLY